MGRPKGSTNKKDELDEIDEALKEEVPKVVVEEGNGRNNGR